MKKHLESTLCVCAIMGVQPERRRSLVREDAWLISKVISSNNRHYFCQKYYYFAHILSLTIHLFLNNLHTTVKCVQNNLFFGTPPSHLFIK